MRFWAASALMAIAAATQATATMVFFTNLCDYQIDLYDNHVTVPLAPSGTDSRDLPVGFKGIFRHGWDPRATLAEFTIDDKAPKAWYDISIIPTNTNGKGPDYCPSLDECKRHTGGGWGFNVQMQIHPRSNQNGAYCKTVTCMHDGCADAYQFPKDDNKTHNCPQDTEFDVVFCPGGNGGKTPSPTTPPPAIEDRSMDELFNSGVVDGGSTGSAGNATEEEAIIEPIPEVTAVPIGTEAPAAVEANTKSEASGSSSVGTVFMILGGVAAVAGVAIIAVIRRKKAALDAMESKDSIALTTPAHAL